MKDQNVNEIEVKGVTRPIQKNDPVSLIRDNVHYQGKVESIDKKGEMILKIYNNKDVKSLTLSKEEKVEPMFSIDKNGKTVFLKYTFDEVKAALENKNEVKVNLPNDKKYFFNLMLGNKTDVISFEKKIDDKFALTEGRLEIKRLPGTGVPYVAADVKFKELNLERPIYGKVLDANQKAQLQKTGELGLVEGFKSREGKEFSLWVSLDNSLNKVVTAKENDIYLGKIFGVVPNEKQLQDLKSGVGTLLEVKDKKYFMMASASSNKADGIKSYGEEKARELKLIPDVSEEKKNSKGKGITM
jgi:hypothetical protein